MTRESCVTLSLQSRSNPISKRWSLGRLLSSLVSSASFVQLLPLGELFGTNWWLIKQMSTWTGLTKRKVNGCGTYIFSSSWRSSSLGCSSLRIWCLSRFSSPLKSLNSGKPCSLHGTMTSTIRNGTCQRACSLQILMKSSVKFRTSSRTRRARWLRTLCSSGVSRLGPFRTVKPRQVEMIWKDLQRKGLKIRKIFLTSNSTTLRLMMRLRSHRQVTTRLSSVCW